MTRPPTFLRFDLRRVSALVVKESVQIVRDPSTFLIAFVLPLILLFIFGYGVSLDASRIRIGLVLEDDSAPALSLAQAYQNSDYFDVDMARSVAVVRDRMVAGDLRAMVVIPSDFGAAVQRGERPVIQIITDGSQPNTANFAAGYAEGVRANWAAAENLESGRAQAPPISLATRYWFNPELKSRYFLVPGSIAIVMTMIGTLLTSLVVAREWERGTMEALMATPVSMAEFIASKIVPYFVLGLGSMALCTVLGITVFGVPFRGSILALLAISSAFLLPALGLGLFISAATKNQFVASQIALLTGFLPAFLLSGFLFEISSMPWPIQMLTYIVPARYLIPPLQTVFVAGDIWSLFLPNIVIMLGFGVAFFALSFRATRRSLD
ncbi:ABC transporter permease [Parasphingopyxis lamellibrachiae]|uniref:ABC-2 type transport system permease protein n=1 Tax=Parasphingopyxis lamellibrachiae TaxID=680125 RepID=A0A3D9FJA9_9SPHN|nr:ABC transporter permease [Parasphingopyxis lamellibrachiae]RED17803.1 ABC-2 type transport system permease protein [Parasphingopyxis lamellibrachiae]